jgi:hypothetical protein
MVIIPAEQLIETIQVIRYALHDTNYYFVRVQLMGCHSCGSRNQELKQ